MDGRVQQVKNTYSLTGFDEVEWLIKSGVKCADRQTFHHILKGGGRRQRFAQSQHFKMAAKTNAELTCIDKCRHIIRNLNLVHIRPIRTHADHYHYAETIQNQLRNITFAKIRILIKKNTPRSTAMPDGTVLLRCGPITDFSLMIGLTIFVNGGR